LRVVSLDIVRTDREFAYITSGLPDGALIVTSALDAVVDGMAVRLPDETAPSQPNERTVPDDPSEKGQ
jgi:hypothetical protein